LLGEERRGSRSPREVAGERRGSPSVIRGAPRRPVRPPGDSGRDHSRPL